MMMIDWSMIHDLNDGVTKIICLRIDIHALGNSPTVCKPYEQLQGIRRQRSAQADMVDQTRTVADLVYVRG